MFRMMFANVLVFAWALPAGADFTDLIVFGDSLSDVGNIEAATFGLQPGSKYFEGRFSNGPVYAEQLAEKLGLERLTHSRAGGNNFAHGGARTSGTSFLEGGFLIQDLDDQISNFLDNRTVASTALHIILAGGNDFVLGGQTDARIPARRIGQQLRRLVGAGARDFLSINLPLLGQTPRFSSMAETMNARSRDFNTFLNDELDEILRQSPDIAIARLDLGELFATVIGVPHAFDFSNVTGQGIEAADAQGFLFWDDVHPTAQAHSLLATSALELFEPWPIAGDLNYGGDLDPSDADILGYAIRNTLANARFDLDHDGALTRSDLETLFGNAGIRNGDLDFSGKVEFNDFLQLARDYGEIGEGVHWSSGDLDVSGDVSLADFLILARNFRNSDQTVAAVPEPSSAISLCLLLLSCCGWRSFGRFAEHADQAYQRKKLQRQDEP